MTTASAAVAAAEMAAAAAALLGALDDAQRARALFALRDPERLAWNSSPGKRTGIVYQELTVAQRHLAHGFLASGLSRGGYAKAVGAMSLEQVLFELENRAPHRDPERYHLWFFGQPGAAAWGWRWEGHHLSLSVAIAGERLAAGPVFVGCNPALVQAGPRRGFRLLPREEDLGRELLRSLDDVQRARAVIAATAPPPDTVPASRHRLAPTPPVGLAAAAMTADQQRQLVELIGEYAGRLRDEIAEQALARIHRVGLDRVRFAWAGSAAPGAAHYYRLHGPTFVIEYDHTQSRANHIHSVWRDLEHDFGEGL